VSVDKPSTCCTCGYHGLCELLAACARALQTLHDLQNGPPLYKYESEWVDAMAKAEHILECIPEKTQ
jgi:hypothetical protein